MDEPHLLFDLDDSLQSQGAHPFLGYDRIRRGWQTYQEGSESSSYQVLAEGGVGADQRTKRSKGELDFTSSFLPSPPSRLEEIQSSSLW